MTLFSVAAFCIGFAIFAAIVRDRRLSPLVRTVRTSILTDPGWVRIDREEMRNPGLGLTVETADNPHRQGIWGNANGSTNYDRLEKLSGHERAVLCAAMQARQLAELESRRLSLLEQTLDEKIAVEARK